MSGYGLRPNPTTNCREQSRTVDSHCNRTTASFHKDFMRSPIAEAFAGFMIQFFHGFCKRFFGNGSANQRGQARIFLDHNLNIRCPGSGESLVKKGRVEDSKRLFSALPVPLVHAHAFNSVEHARGAASSLALALGHPARPIA